MNTKLITLKKALFGAALLTVSAAASSAEYIIDNKGAHASINLKVKHLGYSWLTGRFNEFEGKFSYDAKNVSASKIKVHVNTGSFDSNHAKRDKHIKSADFLEVSKFPEASFVSTSVKDLGDGKLKVKGKITIRKITKEIVINAEKIGEGPDPWNGYRAGFSGEAKITMADFGVPMDLGPASADVYLELHIEGIKKK
ncbi:YceI family protein [Aliikangiella coralliicola]|uniref:YceI family protein n=1 Tax=Aliikangiella coralliicola TaxID=2592383 RepID=A0A545UIJ5_9GAMM|nr:YceI family protein [Aliikangiella coralliicola]TQV89253.1 YceI family protein [Aliikangiella coralliicola]